MNFVLRISCKPPAHYERDLQKGKDFQSPCQKNATQSEILRRDWASRKILLDKCKNYVMNCQDPNWRFYMIYPLLLLIRGSITGRPCKDTKWVCDIKKGRTFFQ